MRTSSLRLNEVRERVTESGWRWRVEGGGTVEVEGKKFGRQ